MEDSKEVKGYVVDGYLFATEEEAKLAQRELQGIRFLQRNNNLKNKKVVLEVYQKLLTQGVFRTSVGLNYLKQLQNKLYKKGKGEYILPIPVNESAIKEQASVDMEHVLQELNDVGAVYRRRFRICVAVIAILSAGLVYMLAVAATTNQPNILNYEEIIIDRYERWEEELQRREDKLKE